MPSMGSYCVRFEKTYEYASRRMAKVHAKHDLFSVTRSYQLSQQHCFDKGRHWKQCQVVLSLAFLECLTRSSPSNVDADGGVRAGLGVARDATQEGGRPSDNEQQANYSPNLDHSARQEKRKEQRLRQDQKQTCIAIWLSSHDSPTADTLKGSTICKQRRGDQGFG